MTNKHKDISGQRFGRLLVLERAGVDSGRSVLWACLCECGTKTVIRGKSLRAGSSQSCGCLRKERAAAANSSRLLKHGETVGGNSRTYRIWTNMVSRCTNQKFDTYPYYGGRGISVCDRWLTFSNFLEDMGRAPGRLTLDRIDSMGDYEPGNCRWASKDIQANNTRRNVVIEWHGEKRTMSQWCHQLGLSVGTVHSRLKRGWSADRALSTPTDVYRKLDQKQVAHETREGEK